ncbi:Transposon Tf2-6 polyprotein [Dictyocoela roeselum]|nr:Transposon Tf2-6 polyprotein [Dictyocoela roeselum]
MFPSAPDDAFKSKKKTNNKQFTRMSLYNQLLIYGRVHPGHIILSSRKVISPEAEDNFTPQRIEFTINPKNTTISLKRSYAMLENIEKQDIFSWRDEFIQTAQLAGWSADTASEVLKSSVDTKYFHLIANLTSLEDMIQAIFKYKYPEKDHVKYLNQLSNVKQNNFIRISEFKDEIIKTTRKLSICLGWNSEMEELKIKEAFYYGLSKRTQLEMTRLNVQDIDTMYQLIDATESTLIEQSKDMQKEKSKTSEKEYKANKSKNEKKPNYCDYHNTNTHDRSNCRALRKISHNSTQKEQNNPSKSNFITEPKMSTQLIEISAKINDNKYNLLLDTGSTLSYIDETVAIQNNLPINETQKCTATLIDGSTVETTKETTIPFHIYGDETTIYKAKVKILNNMSLSGILGMNFLIENDAKIDLSEGILSLDNKHYELGMKRLNDSLDQQIVAKTRINAHVDETYKQKIDELVKEYKLNNKPVGKMNSAEHKIVLTKNEVVTHPPYRISPRLLSKVQQEIEYLLENKIIRHSESSYNSPAFPILKNNGKIRLVIDYRKLNRITVKSCYIFPTINDILTQLHGATLFSTIDLNLGYYQIVMEEQSIRYTAFSINNTKYEFLRMPFGLSNAPCTFQRAMDKILGDLDYVKVYLDDILIHSMSEHNHHQHLTEVFKRLSENNLSINFDKSKFFCREVTFLGHTISGDGISPNIDRVDPLKKITPKNKKHIQRIVGIVNWYRGFIPNASSKISFLTDKLSKATPFSWNETDARKLSEIVNDIESKVKLTYPNPELDFTLETDASAQAMGAVLTQEGNPIGFYSHKFNDSEKNYNTIEKETLAILKALQHFKPLIVNNKVMIRTDNKNLIPEKNLTSRIQRWKLLLQEFNYEIKHIEGSNNVVADTLSRLNFIENNEEYFKFNWEDIKRHQKQDKDLLKLVEEKKLSKRDNELITDDRMRIVLPQRFKQEFIVNIHNQLLHPGIKKTYLTLKNFFTCKDFKKTIAKMINGCEICMRNKNNIKTYGYSEGSITCQNMFEFISSDIYGPIKSCHFISNETSEYFYLITYTDIYSRFTEIYKLKDISAKSILITFKKWCRKYGIPKRFLSDQGRQYISMEFKKYLNENNVKHILTSAYNPTCNGISERINGTIGNICRISRKRTIKELLRNLFIGINFTCHTTLGLSPFELVYKYSPFDAFKRDLTREVNEAKSLESSKAERLCEINKKGRIKHEYKKGDLIFKKMHHPDKIREKWAGPFRIEKLINKDTYVIDEGTKLTRQNIKNIRPYFKRGEDVVNHDINE